LACHPEKLRPRWQVTTYVVLLIGPSPGDDQVSGPSRTRSKIAGPLQLPPNLQEIKPLFDEPVDLTAYEFLCAGQSIRMPNAPTTVMIRAKNPGRDGKRWVVYVDGHWERVPAE
jgi:hypothetical protein